LSNFSIGIYPTKVLIILIRDGEVLCIYLQYPCVIPANAGIQKLSLLDRDQSIQWIFLKETMDSELDAESRKGNPGKRQHQHHAYSLIPSGM
jgi:hypothetical protein